MNTFLPTELHNSITERNKPQQSRNPEPSPELPTDALFSNPEWIQGGNKMRKREYQTSVKNPAVNFTNDDEVSNNNAL